MSNIEEFVSIMASPEWKDKIGRVFNIGGGETCQVPFHKFGVLIDLLRFSRKFYHFNDPNHRLVLACVV